MIEKNGDMMRCVGCGTFYLLKHPSEEAEFRQSHGLHEAERGIDAFARDYL